MSGIGLTSLVSAHFFVRRKQAYRFERSFFLDDSLNVLVEHKKALLIESVFNLFSGHKYASLVMKIFLLKFLMKYCVSTDLQYHELEFQMKLGLTLKQGFMMKIEPR
jgi:hypothetical protein